MAYMDRISMGGIHGVHAIRFQARARAPVDPTVGQVDFLGRGFRVKQSPVCKTWGVVDMETTNKHAKTRKYTRVLARQSQSFFSALPAAGDQLESRAV